MKLGYWHFLALFCYTALAGPDPVQVWQPNPKIGVIGDVHSQTTEVALAVAFFKAHGINLLFGMGDFTDYGNWSTLNRILAQLTEGLQLPRENAILVPGNMEDHFGTYAKYGSVMERYGRLAATSSKSYGFVDLNGEYRFMLSHIAQTPPPQRLLPPPPHGSRRDAIEAFNKNIAPEGVHLAIYGDSHVGGSFVHPTGLVLVNFGTVSERKAVTEKKSIGLILPDLKEAHRIDLVSGTVIERCPFSTLSHRR